MKIDYKTKTITLNKKEAQDLDQYLYSEIKIKHLDDSYIYQGYLVPIGKRYYILGTENNRYTILFSKSNVEYVILTNGFKVIYKKAI